MQFGISVDAVDQFQVETSGQSVEFNGQGSENYTIKSGTNDFHGSLFEYFRNTKLDARGFFAAKRPQQNQNEYGFTFGGPIKRNKIFFFGTYDGYKYRVATDSRFVNIPTLRMRAGDFGELPAAQVIYDPLTLNCPGGANCSRMPFAGNAIPANRISSASRFFQDPLPAPTHPGITSNYLGNNTGVGFNNQNAVVKVDWNATDAHRFTVLFSRGSHNQSSAIRGNPVPAALHRDASLTNAPVGQVKHTWVITPVDQSGEHWCFPVVDSNYKPDHRRKLGRTRRDPRASYGRCHPIVSGGRIRGQQLAAGLARHRCPPVPRRLNSFTYRTAPVGEGCHSIKGGWQHQRLQDNYRRAGMAHCLLPL
jgi:hypothetical protein